MGLFSTNKSNSVTNSTKNEYFDQRQVNDAGGGIIGSGNRLDRSSHYDLSDRSTNYDARSYDLSDRSFTSTSDSRSWDLSDRSTNSDSRSYSYDLSDRSTNNITDGGAFAIMGRFSDGIADIGRLQTSAAERIATSGSSLGNSAFEFAQRAQADAASFNGDALSRTFDLARSSNSQAYQSSRDALGFADETFGDVLGLAKSVVDQAGQQAAEAASTASGAYQAAADTSTGNKTLIYVGMAAVAVVALGFFFKR